jgi:addiction module HigA family antidote
MRIKNPLHPGLLVRQDCLETLGLSITEGAKLLDVTRQVLNNLVNGRAAVSAEIAIQLEKAFGCGAETWHRTRVSHDLAQAEKRGWKDQELSAGWWAESLVEH